MSNGSRTCAGRTRRGAWSSGSIPAVRALVSTPGEFVTVRQHDLEAREPDGVRAPERGAEVCPGIQAEVVVVAARGDEQRTG